MFAICVTSNYSLSIILQASGSYVVIDRGQFRCRLASLFFFFAAAVEVVGLLLLL